MWLGDRAGGLEAVRPVGSEYGVLHLARGAEAKIIRS